MRIRASKNRIFKIKNPNRSGMMTLHHGFDCSSRTLSFSSYLNSFINKEPCPASIFEFGAA